MVCICEGPVAGPGQGLSKCKPLPSCLQACSLGKGEVWGNGVGPVTEAGCLGAGCVTWAGSSLSLGKRGWVSGVRGPPGVVSRDQEGLTSPLHSLALWGT